MVKMKIALALLASLFSVATASAQGPGAAHSPAERLDAERIAALPDRRMRHDPPGVAGGCMGNGTLNVTSLYAGIETINALSNATGSVCRSSG